MLATVAKRAEGVLAWPVSVAVSVESPAVGRTFEPRPRVPSGVLCGCCGTQKEKVQVGDVIYIEATTGAVKRVGRCDA